jgi:hypothetical protein
MSKTGGKEEGKTVSEQIAAANTALDRNTKIVRRLARKGGPVGHGGGSLSEQDRTTAIGVVKGRKTKAQIGDGEKPIQGEATVAVGSDGETIVFVGGVEGAPQLPIEKAGQVFPDQRGAIGDAIGKDRQRRRANLKDQQEGGEV